MTKSITPFFLAIELLVTILACSLSSFGQQSPSLDHTLPDGLRIPAVLENSLSSQKSKVGDPVRLEVAADVHNKTGDVVLHRHSKLTGHVTAVIRYDKKKQPALLSFVVDRAEWKGHSAVLDAAVFGTDVSVTDSKRGEVVEGMGMATLRHTDELNLIARVRMYDFRSSGNVPQTLHDNVVSSRPIMQLVLVPNPVIRTAFVKRDGDVELHNDLLVLLNGMKVVQ